MQVISLSLGNAEIRVFLISETYLIVDYNFFEQNLFDFELFQIIHFLTFFTTM